MLAAPKDFPHRFTTLSDLLTKDFQPSTTATATATATTATSSSASAGNPAGKQPTPGSFNLRYPTPTAFYQREPPKATKSQQMSPSPQQMATSSTTTGLSNDSGEESCKRSSADSDEVTIVELPSERSAQLYKESLEQLLQRQRRTPILGGGTSAGSVIVDATGLRQYTQLLLASGQAESKEKGTSSSSSSSTPPLMNHQHLSQMLKSPSDTCSSLFSSGGGGGSGGNSTGETIEEETRCVVCNAHFPNVWLLEQHAALQHPHVGPGEEKPFICEQCGQSYRYRSAYAKHKEQNHRARLPADKLFTCDVCGMQFRYLKSFKKHRLNHALERLHGKKSVGVGVGVGLGLGRSLTVAAPTSVSVSASASGGSSVTSVDQDVVTSSQEPMLADEGEDLRVNVKREGASNIPTTNSEPGEQSSRESRATADSEEHEQDNTVDSAGITMLYQDNNSSASASTSATEPNISSSDGIHSTNKRVSNWATWA